MYWENASRVIEEVFFKDRIELYENAIVTNSLGEDIEEPTLVGEFKCNIENSENSIKAGEGGLSSPQGLRVSTIKNIALDYVHTYKIKIKSARVDYDSDEFWIVAGWVQSQISTVLTATREVRI